MLFTSELTTVMNRYLAWKTMWLSAPVATSITPLPLAHLSTPTWSHLPSLFMLSPQPYPSFSSPSFIQLLFLSHSAFFFLLSLPANSADAPCHSSYFSLLKFPNWSQLELLQSKAMAEWGGHWNWDVNRKSAWMCFKWCTESDKYESSSFKIMYAAYRAVIVATFAHKIFFYKG